MRDANPQTIYLKDYTVPDYLIHSVDLNFTLAEEIHGLSHGLL